MPKKIDFELIKTFELIKWNVIDLPGISKIWFENYIKPPSLQRMFEQFP